MVDKTLGSSDSTSNGRRFTFSTTAGLLVAYVVLCIVIGAIAPSFYSVDNIITIAQTLAIVGISAIGMTLVLITGGVDISVGSVAALSGVVTSLLWSNNVLPIWAAVIVGLMCGVLVGYINSTVITRLNINPLITTLAMYSIVRGVAFVITGNQTGQLGDAQFEFLGRGSIAGIPFSLLLMIALYLFFMFILRSTTFGRNLYAIGGSVDASRLAGINVRQHLIVAYVLCGLLAALSGLISASQLAAGRPQAATGLEFTVIAAVILGGTNLAGGKGTLVGTFLGVIILRTLDNGLILLNVSSYFQDVARGAVLLLTVGIDQIRIKLERAQQKVI